MAVTQDTLGNYNLRYLIDGISRVEQADGQGNIIGGFSYYDPQGILRKTQFTSGIHGFNAIGTDIPLPVQDTPEVAHAKAKHLSVLNAAYLTPKIPEFQSPYSLGLPAGHLAPNTVPFAVSAVQAPSFYQIGGVPAETPEVLAARAQHFAAHAAARGQYLQ